MSKYQLNSNIMKLLSNTPHYEKYTSNLNLIIPTRFDLIIKFIYARHYKTGTLNKFITDLYLEHINCLNGFVENDDTGKVGKDAFIESYNKLIVDVHKNGLQENTLIPIGKNGSILDGAHRLSTTLNSSINLKTLNFDIDGPIFDFEFFKNRGLSTEQLDFCAIEYALLDKNTHIIIIWPLGEGNEKQLNSIFQEYGEIVYSKELTLNINGLIQLVRLAYSRESWVGDCSNDFVGARNKARWCNKEGNNLRIFLFRTNDNTKLIEMKEKIRNIFSLGKHPIHINDTHEETVELSKFIFNSNTIKWANKSRIQTFEYFSSLMGEFKSRLDKELINNQLIVGSTLSAYGIKESNDLDYINSNNLEFTNINSDIEYETDKIKYFKYDINTLIFDPRNYYYHNELKFLSLQQVVNFKRIRKRDNDVNDLVVLESLVKNDGPYSFSFLELLMKLSKVSFWKSRTKMFLLKLRYYIYKVIK